MISNLTEHSQHRENLNSGILIAQGLKAKSQNYKRLLTVVLQWTGGQPFLTQQLCKLLVESEELPPIGEEVEWVENLVRSHFIENWETLPEAEHLRILRDRILRRKPRSAKLLQLYKQILRHDSLPTNDSSEQRELMLSGLVVKRAGTLRVHNRFMNVYLTKLGLRTL